MKEKLKVYHGLPKTPVDEYTTFYCSFDGVSTSEVGNALINPLNVTVPFPTGYAGTTKTVPKDTITLSEEGTIDFFIKTSEFTALESFGIYADIVAFRFYRTSLENQVYFQVICEGSTSNPVYLGAINLDLTSKFIHIRFTWKDYSHVHVYLNGKQVINYTSSSIVVAKKYIQQNENICLRVFKPISDLHISSIDRGDYFPTLPQDFIDGKAIVVPALNQRQSYGDPVLHQVTELLVPCSAEHYGSMDSDTGLYTSVKNPELSVDNYTTWREGARIHITGLHNSVITGVFDTDTAKCRVIKDTTSDRYIHVDSVSGLSVGDTVQIRTNNLIDTYTWTGIATITEIDTTNNTFKTDLLNGYPPKGCYVFETTVSSSSPVVKTVDGTTVNGVWSDLGTRLAVFRIMENSNIAGKDLVVTYCLNAIGNSSPYPKMPSEVIRGYDKLGNELVPVTSVAIQDDFKRKIAGSIKECPHSLKYALDSVLRLPSHHWNEFTQSYYNTSPSIASHIQGHMAQILVEVDLVKFVENKMGVEIPGNKLDWLNANVKSIRCNALVRGNSNNNNKCYIKYFNGINNIWALNSKYATCDSTEPTLIQGVITPDGSYLKSTKYYFLIHSDALSVTGNDVKCRVILHDVQLELTLNTDERYDYLYTKNLASREDYCNPILVDKQTKEVKRLLPSTAPFSTEVLLHSPTKQDKYFEDLGLLYDPSHTYITTHGTGTSCPTYDVFRGLVAKLDMSALFPHKLLSENLFNSPVTNATYRSSKIKRVLSQPYPSNFNFDSVEDAYEVDSVYLSPRIVQYEKEVYLYVLAYQLDCTNCRDNSATTQVIYKLPNRPLIK